MIVFSDKGKSVSATGFFFLQANARQQTVKKKKANSFHLEVFIARCLPVDKEKRFNVAPNKIYGTIKPRFREAFQNA